MNPFAIFRNLFSKPSKPITWPTPPIPSNTESKKIAKLTIYLTSGDSVSITEIIYEPLEITQLFAHFVKWFANADDTNCYYLVYNNESMDAICRRNIYKYSICILTN